MISTNDLRNGMTIELDGQVWAVIEFLHVKPGKGSAFVRSKLRNVETGSVSERTFRAGEKLPRAHLERREMQYLYRTAGEFSFLDNESFEQLALSADELGGQVNFLKEGLGVIAVRHKDRMIGVELPNSVELEVIETDPGVRGDTASGGTKPAKLETGLVVHVPLFINQGDVLRVDTRTGQYLVRV
ncbi:MAG: elongation factor P [Bacillota bacterium]|nr:elongation factor P [Bacillota bacterium]